MEKHDFKLLKALISLLDALENEVRETKEIAGGRGPSSVSDPASKGEVPKVLHAPRLLFTGRQPSSRLQVVAVACYDLGEFVRFYPNGKSLVKNLGGKDMVMKLIEHDNLEVQREALQCMSKIMVNQWEFVR